MKKTTAPTKTTEDPPKQKEKVPEAPRPSEEAAPEQGTERKKLEYTDIVQSLRLLDWNDDLWTYIEYQGMNPAELMREFLSYCDSNGINANWAATDISYMVLIASKRGTAFKKMKSQGKNTPQLNEILATLTKTWDLQDNLKDNNNPKVFTVSRLIGLFPEISLVLFSEEKAVPLTGWIEGLPTKYHFPGAPTMMDESTWTKHKDKFILFMLKFNKIINPNSNMTEDKIRQTQENIARSMLNNGFNSSARKHRWTTARALAKRWSFENSVDDEIFKSDM